MYCETCGMDHGATLCSHLKLTEARVKIVELTEKIEHLEDNPNERSLSVVLKAELDRDKFMHRSKHWHGQVLIEKERAEKAEAECEQLRDVMSKTPKKSWGRLEFWQEQAKIGREELVLAQDRTEKAEARAKELEAINNEEAETRMHAQNAQARAEADLSDMQIEREKAEARVKELEVERDDWQGRFESAARSLNASEEDREASDARVKELEGWHYNKLGELAAARLRIAVLEAEIEKEGE